jgi:hypothetical protein
LNQIRIVLFSLVTYFAFGQASEQLSFALSDGDVIKTDGLLNIWASYSSLFLGLYIVIYSLKALWKLSLYIGEINRVLLVACLIIAPLLAIGTYSQAKANVADYVECKSERKLSSRYSSRTYARTEELCLSLTPKQGEPTSSTPIP